MKYLTWLICLLVLTPLLALLGQALADDQQAFVHIWNTVLATYVGNSLGLLAWVLVFSLLLAVPSAWLVACTELPGRRHWAWLLLLPLAMPGYLVAYVYTDLLELGGRWHHLAFFEVRSLVGAALMLALVLFPYLFLLAFNAFRHQGASLWEAGRTLGHGNGSLFWRISLPLARPALVAGLALIGMEALGDFATVDYFAVQTLTTAVFDTWQGQGSLASAARLSWIMLIFIFLLLAIERLSRGQQAAQGGTDRALLLPLKPWQKALALLWCLALLLVAFLLPLWELGRYALNYWQWQPAMADAAGNSLLLALGSAAVALVLALVVALDGRRRNHWLWARVAASGYAIPGTVLAIGVLIPLGLADEWLNDGLIALGQSPVGLVLSGSLVALLLANVVRFLAVALGAVESRLGQLSPDLEAAAQSLGAGPGRILARILLPLLRSGLAAAVLLVFIEVLKELPAALILRPFGYETLATFVFRFASDEQLELAALPALLIVLVGLLPVAWLSRMQLKGKTDAA